MNKFTITKHDSINLARLPCGPNLFLFSVPSQGIVFHNKLYTSVSSMENGIRNTGKSCNGKHIPFSSITRNCACAKPNKLYKHRALHRLHSFARRSSLCSDLSKKRNFFTFPFSSLSKYSNRSREMPGIKIRTGRESEDSDDSFVSLGFDSSKPQKSTLKKTSLAQQSSHHLDSLTDEETENTQKKRLKIISSDDGDSHEEGSGSCDEDMSSEDSSSEADLASISRAVSKETSVPVPSQFLSKTGDSTAAGETENKKEERKRSKIFPNAPRLCDKIKLALSECYGPETVQDYKKDRQKLETVISDQQNRINCLETELKKGKATNNGLWSLLSSISSSISVASKQFEAPKEIAGASVSCTENPVSHKKAVESKKRNSEVVTKTVRQTSKLPRQMEDGPDLAVHFDYGRESPFRRFKSVPLGKYAQRRCTWKVILEDGSSIRCPFEDNYYNIRVHWARFHRHKPVEPMWTYHFATPEELNWCKSVWEKIKGKGGRKPKDETSDEEDEGHE